MTAHLKASLKTFAGFVVSKTKKFLISSGSRLAAATVVVSMLVTQVTPASALTWSTGATNTSQWRSIAYGNGMFVAVADGGTQRAMYSYDGINWTLTNAAANNAWNSVAYGDGKFVAVAWSGTNRFMYSTDGINWTGFAAPGGDNDAWQGITYGGGQFVAINCSANTSQTCSTGSAFAATSPDGLNWTTRNVAVSGNDWRAITYGNGTYVAVATTGTNNRAMTSPDGITWTARNTASVNNEWYSVTYGKGLFVASGGQPGNNNRIVTSPDGITWTARSHESVNNTWRVAYGDGKFVAVGPSSDGDGSMSSQDGITWTVDTGVPVGTWVAVAYGAGQFVAVSCGPSGTACATTSGIRTMTTAWTPTPAISSISPASKTAGQAQFTLTVNGSDFMSDSIVRFNGSNRTTNTTNYESGVLTATITAADIEAGGTYNVTVHNPTGSKTSTAKTLTVNNPSPTLTSISPTSKNANSGQFSLTLNGTNFNSSTVAMIDGQSRSITARTSTQLTVTILAADITSPGTRTITVANPAPGGGTSGGQTLTIDNATPVLSSISPTTSVINQEFTLTLNGSGFGDDSVVKIGDVETVNEPTVESSTKLTVVVTGDEVSSLGGKTVTVTNPAPGGGTSAGKTLTVAAGNETTCPASGTDVTIDSPCQFAVGTYTYSGTLTISAAVTALSNQPTYGQIVLNSTNINVTNTGSINADGRGYAAGAGPGGGTGYQGGTYGGRGGSNNDAVYGSVTEPTDVGSGSGLNGRGGGSIKLAASGTLTVDGNVYARATFVAGCAHAGGSGGSVWLSAGTLAGSGNVSVAGGSADSCGGGDPNGGGGGRIAVYYSAGTPSINYNVGGGSKHFVDNESGGSGTLYIHGPGATDGSLTLDNNNIDDADPTPMPSSITFDTVTIADGGELGVLNGQMVTVTNSSSFSNAGDEGGFEVSEGGTLDFQSSSLSLDNVYLINRGSIGDNVTDITVAGAAITEAGESFPELQSLTVNSGGVFSIAGTHPRVIDTVTVNSSGLLTHVNNSTAQDNIVYLIADTFTVNTGGSINVNSRGYNATYGPGGAAFVSSNGAGGAGHAGAGGNGSGGAGGAAYDSAETPAYVGSGGGTYLGNAGGAGGGYVHLVIGSLITVNGSITANAGNATNNFAGGGSGGAVFIEAGSGTIAGNGTISANGGQSVDANGGCGAGGFITLTYDAKTFSGSATANAATTPCNNAGGAGIVTEVAAPPVTTSISPSTKNAGDGQFTITVNGSNFNEGATVKIGGASRATTFVNSTQLTATVLAADNTAGGYKSVTVTNGAPTGGTSNPQLLAVNHPVPVTSSISPATRAAASGQFTMTVNGSNFATSSVVRVNGSNRSTTYVNAGQLTATVLADDILEPGSVTVTVFTPTPGGGTSNGQTLTVTDSVVITSDPTSPFNYEKFRLTVTVPSLVDGVQSITIYLGGTDPQHQVGHCDIDGEPASAECSVILGPLSRGVKTFYAVVTDGDGDEVEVEQNVTIQAATTNNRIKLSRIKVSEISEVELSYTLDGATEEPLVVTFPDEFQILSAFTDLPECASNPGFTEHTLTADVAGCAGTLVFSGATVVNPPDAGTYIIRWTDDEGEGSVIIVEADGITVTAAVDPYITFDVGAQDPGDACDGTFSSSEYVIPLGVLTSTDVTTSDAGGIKHICTHLWTNATNGAVVVVNSLNAGLASASVPSDAIPSATGTVTAGTPNYGICFGTDVGDSGTDVTVPVGAAPTASAPFNGTCTVADHVVGGLNGSNQTLWSIDNPSQNAFAKLYVKASVSGTSPAHTDYWDLLTFVATATF